MASVSLALFVSLFASTDVTAADWPEEDFNPLSLADDVVLPMPCGGAMAFRKVIVPSIGPLTDKQIIVGGTDDTRGYSESARPAYIAGNFGDDGSDRYYLIGKYEVSRRQYRSLDVPCPEPAADLRLPQVEVGWLDAVTFADRYTLWLRQNAADALPMEGSEAAFLRLPTEEEWEFAARGGIQVSDSDFREPVFPMPDGDLVSYVWFAGTQSSNNQLQRIGLLKANPLGIHDILGNADEIVLEPFRLNKLDRLHGQVGGFIIRGGNYKTSEEDVRAAYRHEVPFYRENEPRRSGTTGFRLVVVAPIIASRERLMAIEEAWAELGNEASTIEPERKNTLGDKSFDDPLEELGAIQQVISDKNLKERLEKLQLAFRAKFQTRNEQQERAAKAALRLGTFLCQKLRDDGLPIDRLKDVFVACVEARGATHERCVNQKALIDGEESSLHENLRYYADTVVNVVNDYNESVISGQLTVMKSELTARGLEALIPIADLYTAHVRSYRATKTIDRTEWLQECKKI
jgi:formylglycine-generating enzyme required for sulfatase activity